MLKGLIKLIDVSCMLIPWNFFFFLCEKHLTIPLATMLYLMEYVCTYRKQQS